MYKIPTFDPGFAYIIQHMRYQIQLDKRELHGEITLPSSKSISNRLLILNALAEKEGRLENLSESDDTRVLVEGLGTGEGTVDIGHAGTSMRFLAAYLSIQPGEYILTGSRRMQQRPIGKLVDALKDLGAKIEYLDRTGYPPLSIRGEMLNGGEINVDSSISSQYISALMMIGPALKEGLVIRLENEVVSASYIQLTQSLMRDLGIPVKFTGTRIEVPCHNFEGKNIYVEGDWSAASYWYAIAALADHAEFEIKGLQKESLQGDSVLPVLFRQFGVDTTFTEDGIQLKTIQSSKEKFEYNFGDSPDLAQTVALVCGLLNIPFRFTGTGTLKIKETDRVVALQTEMKKLGILVDADPEGEWMSWDGNMATDLPGIKQIKTYQDHRMAMAFAPAAILFPGLIIEDPDVVKKSYPGFWNDLQNVGFNIKVLNSE
jgi:3-phosphoshikimate 1-carboxyvinyltransferase